LFELVSLPSPASVVAFFAVELVLAELVLFSAVVSFPSLSYSSALVSFSPEVSFSVVVSVAFYILMSDEV
jgi:hypothetical protein